MNRPPARPDHISEADWNNMSWYQQNKIAQSIARVRDIEPPAAIVVDITEHQAKRRRPPQRVRVYQARPGEWILTNGRTTAVCVSAQQAWSLIAQLDPGTKAAAQ